MFTCDKHGIRQRIVYLKNCIIVLYLYLYFYNPDFEFIALYLDFVYFVWEPHMSFWHLLFSSLLLLYEKWEKGDTAPVFLYFRKIAWYVSSAASYNVPMDTWKDRQANRADIFHLQCNIYRNSFMNYEICASLRLNCDLRWHNSDQPTGYSRHGIHAYGHFRPFHFHANSLHSFVSYILCIDILIVFTFSN